MEFHWWSKCERHITVNGTVVNVLVTRRAGASAGILLTHLDRYIRVYALDGFNKRYESYLCALMNYNYKRNVQECISHSSYNGLSQMPFQVRSSSSILKMTNSMWLFRNLIPLLSVFLVDISNSVRSIQKLVLLLLQITNANLIVPCRPQ